ncbi:serine/threonine protein kinase [Paucibacter sp. APW11]|uniref:Stress response kinase A n=1 Tax=Roseateles aquae TaxID=3077235 RepID=A0ABU3PHZ6_9BURK|nr:serine/threonine protein kinase [Paucibacter sp. APW11]MDT9002190.1 serine/threonine protein kinase [Paucibacter sp. APW11]
MDSNQSHRLTPNGHSQRAAQDAQNKSFAALTPEFMLDALDGAGLYGDGRMLQLNSYENRVLQLHLEDGRIAVAKFYRPGRWSDAQILEEHRFAQQLAAAEVPVAAPWPLQSQRADLLLSGEPATLAHYQGQRFAVTPRQGGRAPELEDPEVLCWIGRLLGRLHAVGRQQPFKHRLRWVGAEPGRLARDWLIEQGAVPPDIQPAWDDVVQRCLARIQQAFDAIAGLQLLRLHGDCHPGNILWTPDRGPHFVDLDDAVTGPAVQDLWMLLSGDAQSARQQLASVLEGYEMVAEFDRRELSLIEPLRTLRMIHHSAWLAKRWSDPAFPLAFPWFGTPNYWNDQVAKLREQLEAMEPAEDEAAPRFADDDDEPFEFDKGFR